MNIIVLFLSTNNQLGKSRILFIYYHTILVLIILIFSRSIAIIIIIPSLIFLLYALLSNKQATYLGSLIFITLITDFFIFNNNSTIQLRIPITESWLYGLLGSIILFQSIMMIKTKRSFHLNILTYQDLISKLENSETRMRESQKIAQIANWEYDLVNGKSAFSEEYYNIFEIDKDINHDRQDLLRKIHPEDRHLLINSWNVENEDDGLITHENHIYRIITKDQRIKYIRGDRFIYFDDEGKQVYRKGVVQDVTEFIKQSDEILLHKQMNYEGSKIGNIGYWESFLSSNYLKWSDEVFRIFDVDSETDIITKDTYWETIHPQDKIRVRDWIHQMTETKTSVTIDFRIFRPNGEIRHVSQIAQIISDSMNNERKIVGAIRDITDEYIQRTKLEQSLQENELLLRELQHRVQNNIQILLSLLDLEKYSDNTKEDIITNFTNRIQAIALSHQILVKSNYSNNLDFKNYVKNIVDFVLKSYDYDGKITITIEMDEIPLELDTGIPLGLILNEIVTNSIKHAFSENITNPSISISGEHLNNQFKLVIQDNGIGAEVLNNPNSLGMKIIQALASQIDGTLNFDDSSGTRIELIF